MLYIVQHLDFSRCSPQQQWENFYMGEIRTDCSVSQCKGPLKGPENLMSTLSLLHSDIFSAVWGYIRGKRHLHHQAPFSVNKNGLSLLFLVTSGQNVKSSLNMANKTKCPLNENGQELVFLDDLCISCYFYRQLLFGTMTCDLWGSYWILERGKEHKVYWSTSPGLHVLQGESL